MPFDVVVVVVVVVVVNVVLVVVLVVVVVIVVIVFVVLVLYFYFRSGENFLTQFLHWDEVRKGRAFLEVGSRRCSRDSLCNPCWVAREIREPDKARPPTAE